MRKPFLSFQQVVKNEILSNWLDFSSTSTPGTETLNLVVDFKQNRLPLMTSLSNTFLLMFFESTDNFGGPDGYWKSGDILFKIYTAINGKLN